MVTAEAAYLEPAGRQLPAEAAVGIRTTMTTTTTIDDSATNDAQHSLSSALEPVSLGAHSAHSDQSENVTTASTTSTTSTTSTDSDYGGDSDDSNEQQRQPIKCSAVHTLERDMPDFDYSHLVGELRKLILEHARANAGLYSPADVAKCASDDWHLSRFLLRQKMDLQLAFEMLKEAMRFNHESLANHLKASDFPAEIYQLGGLFTHGVDRKGNRMLYMRVRKHKKTPEIAIIVQAFIYYNIKRLDEEAQGRGISVVIDCTAGGLANADMDTLLFIISTLKNYFPKGLSYFLVHEIPWILKPFWHIAKAWVPDEHRQLIKFSDSSSVFEYIDRDNLPDYMGGKVAQETYTRVPEDCTTLEQASKLWGIERRIIRRVLDKFRDDLPPETVQRIESNFAMLDKEEEEAAAAASLPSLD